jgi:hypothetical protein
MVFVQAQNYTRVSGRRVIRLIVLHSMESPEKPGTARAVAAWFAGSTAPKASAHYCVDGQDVVQCVREQDVAWAAPDANHDGLQIEIAGRAAQSAAEWRTPPAILDNVSTLVARLCRKYDIPPVFLTADQVREGRSGVTSHANVTKAYPGPGRTHWDPGPGFPTGEVMNAVRRKMAPPVRKPKIQLVVAGEPVASGYMNRGEFVNEVGRALVRDGARPPFNARIDGRVVGRGRLWPWIRPFNRRVTGWVRDGAVVQLSDHVSLRLES